MQNKVINKINKFTRTIMKNNVLALSIADIINKAVREKRGRLTAEQHQPEAVLLSGTDRGRATENREESDDQKRTHRRYCMSRTVNISPLYIPSLSPILEHHAIRDRVIAAGIPCTASY